MPNRGFRQHDVVLEEPPAPNHNGNHINGNHNQVHQQLCRNDPSMTTCCVPSVCHIEQPIHMSDLTEAVKVICNNSDCQEGRYMHKSCFETWEESVLTFLRSTGRARSWSEKQRLQNLWTKKGYDLAFKACGCKCGKGHLRKDLDWSPPAVTVAPEEVNKKKKNRKKKGNDKPTLSISGVPNANVKHVTICHQAASNGNANGTGQSNGMQPLNRNRSYSMSSTGSGGSSEGASPTGSTADESSPTPPVNCSMKKFFFSDTRQRHNSGSIFSRRQDYSSFNILPRHKINSYHIKMEDDGNHGNDETRCFILSTLSANHMSKTFCVICQGPMMIFDRYPLVDGTFFMSPRQHNRTAVPVNMEGKTLFMNAVCMGCLEGWTHSVRCNHCRVRWNGSHLILGSMYSYDIFAAVPCCVERLRCNNCKHLVISPDSRLDFFSDYSHSLPCVHCGIVDHHFVKPLTITYSLERE